MSQPTVTAGLLPGALAHTNDVCLEVELEPTPATNPLGLDRPTITRRS